VTDRSLARRNLFRLAVTAAAATTAGAVGLRGTPAQAAAQRPLRLMTYNIHHGVGLDDVLDLERQARLIEDSGADVVGLQEVDRHWSERSDWLDQAAWFGDRLGMAYVHGANLDLDPPEPGAPRRQYGTAFLSSWPITASRNTFLPWEPGTEQRGLLEITIDVRGVALRFGNTHLQHRAQDAALRLAQAQRVVELLGSSPDRTFLVGDLNAVPGTPEIKVVADVLPDTWDAVGGEPGYTYPAEAPASRIDYVFGSPDAEPLRGDVAAPSASDHLPVTVHCLVR
jgi:endonuclease/exonuclease/phosphatase family metal-dependent hydrolase